MAMKLGGEYRLHDIGLRQWQKLAKEVRRDPESVIGRVVTLADMVSDRVPEVAQQLAGEGLKHPILGRLSKGITERAAHCKRLLRF